MRTRSRPAGLAHLSPATHRKVRLGNSQNRWVRSLVDKAVALRMAYWVENPDGSLFWLMPGWGDEKAPTSSRVLRADMCTFGTLWRKRTRVATNTSLAGARLLCKRKGNHLRLVGYSRERRRPWTRVAQVYPGGFADIRALAVAAKVGWSKARPRSSSLCKARVMLPNRQSREARPFALSP